MRCRRPGGHGAGGGAPQQRAGLLWRARRSSRASARLSTTTIAYHDRSVRAAGEYREDGVEGDGAGGLERAAARAVLLSRTWVVVAARRTVALDPIAKALEPG